MNRFAICQSAQYSINNHTHLIKSTNFKANKTLPQTVGVQLDLGMIFLTKNHTQQTKTFEIN